MLIKTLDQIKISVLRQKMTKNGGGFRNEQSINYRRENYA